jgi:diguanylate cyclase
VRGEAAGPERRTPARRPDALTAGSGETAIAPDPLARAIALLLVVAVVGYAASTFLRSEPGYDPLLDGALRLGAHGLAALLVVLRPLRSPMHRRLWTWVAVAVTTRSIGVLAFAIWVRPLDPQPYPSIADAWWAATYLALLIAVALLAVDRRHHRRSVPLVLDGLVAALAVAAVALAVIDPALEAFAAEAGNTLAVAVNLGYPLLDVVLLVVTAGVLAAGRGPRSPAVWVLAAGILLLAVVDVTYLRLTVTSGLTSGGWLSTLSSLSLGASALLAMAAWAPDRPFGEPSSEVLPRLVAPVTASFICLGVLVAASAAALPITAVGAATAGMVAAIARTAVTFRLVRSAAEHRQAARTDDLTGAANRRACNEALERALSARPADGQLALVVLDLDGFREVNDTYGHHHGDELLRLISQRLADAVRDGDLLARIGGDEFAVVMDGVGLEAAEEVADRLRASLRRPLTVGVQHLSVDASVGIAVCPQDASDAAELLRLADLAMYDAKSSGAGIRAYDARRHVTAESLRRTVSELRQGIARGELVVHYQPQVALATGEVVGVESLVRWQHPREGLLAPSVFLPLAESGGLMRQLTLAVLEEAARQTAVWHAAGTPIKTAVNLSVSTLLDLEFPTQLDGVLDAAGLPSGALTLELTEELFVVDPVRAQRQVSALLDRGIGLWVDDYGTGYSSLGYLRDLDGLAGIKLDRSFVSPIDTDHRARAIVASTITLARSLDLEVVAEGVETAPVRDILADLGCRTAQGYLFSRPLPAADLDLGPIAAGRARPT